MVGDETVDRPVAERVVRAAGTGGLGAHVRSVRVNAAYDARARFNAVGCLIGAVVVVALAALAPVPAVMVAVNGVVAAVLVLVALLDGGNAVRARRIGAGYAHLFEDGIVLERARGGLRVIPAAAMALEHVTWLESDSGGSTRRTALVLGCGRDDPVMLEARSGRERQALASIAAQYGHHDPPAAISGSDRAASAGHW